MTGLLLMGKNFKVNRVNIIAKLGISVIGALAFSFTAYAQSNSIEAISSINQSGKEIVKIDFSQPLTKVPEGFSIQTPARIALDFPGTANAIGKNLVEINRLVQRLRESLVHLRERGDTPLSGFQRLARDVIIGPASLHTQQGGHGLEVVLHAVVDLADRGILGHELLLAAAKLRDVADHDDRTKPLPLIEKGDGAH